MRFNLSCRSANKMKPVSPFTLERSATAYTVDFVLYLIASLALATFIVLDGPENRSWELVSFSLAALLGWTAVEYVLHRFVLHGLRPFSTWHAEHHRSPMALICTPTWISGFLIVAFVFLPALWLSDIWRADAVTLGILIGYFLYGVTHHAMHYWRFDNAWIKRRKMCHALHHHSTARPGYFGVTNSFWDWVFRSDRA